MRPEEKYRKERELIKAKKEFEENVGEQLPEGCCVCLDSNDKILILPTSKMTPGALENYARVNKNAINGLGYNESEKFNPRSYCSGVYVKQ